jgi:hypothetical protein
MHPEDEWGDALEEWGAGPQQTEPQQAGPQQAGPQLAGGRGTARAHYDRTVSAELKFLKAAGQLKAAMVESQHALQQLRSQENAAALSLLQQHIDGWEPVHHACTGKAVSMGAAAWAEQRTDGGSGPASQR